MVERRNVLFAFVALCAVVESYFALNAGDAGSDPAHQNDECRS